VSSISTYIKNISIFKDFSLKYLLALTVFSIINLYKLKKCSKKECCKQCRYVKFKGTMTQWPVQKQTHRTTQKHVEHQDVTDI